MIVSWNWLKELVGIDRPAEEVAERLAMAGLNLESITSVDDDLAIDLEVTSNRPDCLGHLGVAREVGVLYGKSLRVPDPRPKETGPPANALTQVTVENPDHCYQYTARVIRGVKVGPSPPWLAARLRTLGISVINNIVDISNYVLMECGQPLHTFDFDRLEGRAIIVRQAASGETFEAIDHRTYTLDPSMCVIADRSRPVAIGGVMGGLETEVTEATTSVLVESARFAPTSIRTTARRLNLHSASSYRFERGVDPAGVDWASRRCCALILELAGGELAQGVVVVGASDVPDRKITLRFSQIARVLGIHVGAEEIVRILEALGGGITERTAESVTVVAPSWRRDWEREVDLVEEVARIHGYDAIPEDVPVPMAGSHRRPRDRVLAEIRRVLTAHGYDEAITASVVPADWTEAVRIWTDQPALATQTPMLRGADRLRTSLLPSLLDARRLNESLGNFDAHLFETAAIYLPSPNGPPREQPTLAWVTPHSFRHAKGVLEAVLDALHIEEAPQLEDAEAGETWEPGTAVQWRFESGPFAVVGRISPKLARTMGLREPVCVGEADWSALAARANLVPQAGPISPYPSIRRDVNLVVDESVRWADLEATVRDAAGDLLESLAFREIYRDPKKDGAGKKRMFFTMTFRSPTRTLTGEEVDTLRDAVVAACHDRLGARLLAG